MMLFVWSFQMTIIPETEAKDLLVLRRFAKLNFGDKEGTSRHDRPAFVS